MKAFSKLAFLVVLLVAPAAPAQESCRIPGRLDAAACARTEDARGRPGDFDFYIFSLSWSPAFCASEAGARKTGQCRDNGFGWVVHGLWPQYSRDRNAAPPWPQYCAPVADVPAPVLRRHFCAMPDQQLMQCQWAKHGSCAAFATPEDYFAAIARLQARFALPAPQSEGMPAAALRRAVLAAHPGLQARHLQVIRRDGKIREVRLCLDRALQNPVDCRG